MLKNLSIVVLSLGLSAFSSLQAFGGNTPQQVAQSPVSTESATVQRSPMSADERLEAGRKDAAEGRYADALNEYIWYHNHALETDRAQYGVRLTFALGYWMELAGVYPPARVALKEVRDDKTQRLVSGTNDVELFNDVQSINRELGNEEATYDLFVAIHQRDPVFAAQCAPLARSELIKAQAFKLAGSYIPDPMKEIDRMASQMNRMIFISVFETDAKSKAASIDTAVHIYVDNIKQLTYILWAEKSGDNRAELRKYAIAQVDELKARKKVEALLLPCGAKISAPKGCTKKG